MRGKSVSRGWAFRTGILPVGKDIDIPVDGRYMACRPPHRRTGVPGKATGHPGPHSSEEPKRQQECAAAAIPCIWTKCLVERGLIVQFGRLTAAHDGLHPRKLRRPRPFDAGGGLDTSVGCLTQVTNEASRSEPEHSCRRLRLQARRRRMIASPTRARRPMPYMVRDPGSGTVVGPVTAAASP